MLEMPHLSFNCFFYKRSKFQSIMLETTSDSSFQYFYLFIHHYICYIQMTGWNGTLNSLTKPKLDWICLLRKKWRTSQCAYGVVLTSIRRRPIRHGRRIDVKITLCAYAGILNNYEIVKVELSAGLSVLVEPVGQ